MSHHGDQHPNPEFLKKLLLETRVRDEGEFPNGRLNSDDAGALALAIAVEDGKVCMHFAKSVEWIGFTPQQAMDLANLLMQNARKAGSKEPLTLRIG